MSKQPKFSVVLPIYNVEKHLKQAIDSVLHQKFQDFEIILVNDCSPDNSLQICEAYCEKDERIKLLSHEQNKGLSAARNTGLSVACGEYIWFMDSDDYVDGNLLENVNQSIEQNPADVVVFGAVEEYFDKKGVYKYSKEQKVPGEIIASKERIHERIIELEEATLYGYAWNKFYKTDKIKRMNLQFENVTLIEDITFNVKYFMDIHTMNILEGCPYHYEKRIDNSLTSKFVPDYFRLHEERIKMIREQYIYWNAYSEDIKKRLGNIYARYIVSAMQRNCDKRSKMGRKVQEEWLDKLYNDKLFLELSPMMKPKSGSMKIIVGVIKSKKRFICYFMANVIYIVKNKLPIIFAKLKENR